MIVAVIVRYKTKVNLLPGIKTIIVDNTKNNRGFAGGVNLGIKKALKIRAQKIVLINPDLKITKQEIEALSGGDIVAPVLISNGIYDFGGKINWIIGRTTHSQGDSPQFGGGSPYETDYVSGACMVIKREVFEKIGLFDERFFMYFEDADFCWRAKKAGFKVAVDPRVTITHNLTKNKKKIKYALESNLKFINKWVPWYFRPLAWAYWVLLACKIAISFSL